MNCRMSSCSFRILLFWEEMLCHLPCVFCTKTILYFIGVAHRLQVKLRLVTCSNATVVCFPTKTSTGKLIRALKCVWRAPWIKIKMCLRHFAITEQPKLFWKISYLNNVLNHRKHVQNIYVYITFIYSNFRKISRQSYEYAYIARKYRSWQINVYYP